MAACFISAQLYANPVNPTVVNGTATFNQAGNLLTVTNSNGAIINWDKFSIKAGETTHFAQTAASSTVLNRVLNDPTAIYGTLSSNGRVWLVNPAGIMVGPGGRVDTAGFVASTLAVRNEDFLAGRHLFVNDGMTGKVINQGEIRTPAGGSVYLIGNSVTNEGIITTPAGETILAAGHTVSLIDSATPGVKVDITGSEGNATNLGSVIAEAGRIGIAGALVRNAGILNASSVVDEGGRIFLRASKTLELSDTSKVSADGSAGGSVAAIVAEHGQITGELLARGTISAQGNGEKGSGGFVETSARTVDIGNVSVNTRSGTWLLDPDDVEINGAGTLAGATLVTPATIQNALANNDFVVGTNAGGTGGNGDIFVNGGISWSIHKLTLSAGRNIAINASLNGSGTASLALEYGLSLPQAGNPAKVTVNAPVSLPAGANFSTRLGSDGSTVPYTVITSLGAAGSTTAAELQGMNGGLAGRYALGANIDASATSGWNSGAGFVPVGNATTAFTGSFDGLGHSISGLVVNTPSDPNAGLFGAIGAATISNVGLIGGSVTGSYNVGALVGSNTGGTVRNSYAETTVTAAGTGAVSIPGMPAQMAKAGGLVGLNSGGTVTESHATGTVSGIRATGGLVGLNIGGSTLSFSYASGKVSGTEMIGGLVGINDYQNTNLITDSYATGNVSGTSTLGGLVGWNGHTITRSHASGNVSGTGNSVGGLAGYNRWQTISDSYATGSVTGYDQVGGLVGYNEYDNGASAWGTISGSYATGNVSGHETVAGLVGWNGGFVANSYASGNVTATGGGAGGLVGYNRFMSVSDSYATGEVTGSYNVGGLVGHQEANGQILRSYASGAASSPGAVGGMVGYSGSGASITGSYWDTETSGLSQGFGTNLGTFSAVGLTSAQMRQAASFAALDLVNTWWLSEGYTRPFLRSEYSTTITNAHQLQLMAIVPAASYKLAGTIDLGPALAAVNGKYPGMWGSAGFTPVANYTGTFDGLGYVVNGLAIDRGATDYVGLFGYTNGATVRNVGLTDVKVTGSSYVGGLVGWSNNSTIANSYSTGVVTGNVNHVGGLVGRNDNVVLTNSYSTVAVTGSGAFIGGLVGDNTSGSTISSSYSSGAVSGGSNAGGLVGRHHSSTINNSYSTGTVTGSDWIGGLVGHVDSVTIANSYATGAVTSGGGSVGGLVGHNIGGYTVTNSYWDMETTGRATSVGGTGKTSAELLTQATYGWDFTNTWWMADGSTRPFLRSELSTTITNAHQLQLMAVNLSGNYKLAGNIDLGPALAAVSGKYPGMWGSAGFVPVGNASGKFTGTLEGQGHLIDNLFINRPGTNYAGLFGYMDTGSSVKNLGLENAKVTGGVFVGALVGEKWSGTTVDNVHSTGSMVSVASSPNSIVGGLVGRNQGILSNSYSTASATGNYDNAGGLVGINDVGTISNSYSTGPAHGNWNVGGFAGTNYGTIVDSYSTGRPTQTGANIGGLVGNSIGGTVTNSYWDTETSGMSSSAGGSGGTNAQMRQQATFSGFDFTNVWNIVSGTSYPYLKSQFSGTPQVLSGTVTGLGGGKTIQAVASGVDLAKTFTGANGFYYFALPGNSVPSGNVLLAYVAGDTFKGATAAGSSGTHITNLAISQNAVTVAGGSIGNSSLGTARGALASTDIPYSVATGNLTLSSGFALQTLSGANYTLDGNVTTVDAAQTWGGPVSMTANAILAAGNGPIAINGAISGATRNLTLNTSGSVTQSAAITVAGLELLGAGGNYQLTHGGNAVTNLAGNTGTINFTDSNGFTVGTVNSTNGATVTGDMTLLGTGSITVNKNVSSTAGGITLNSTESIIQTGGTISATGTAYLTAGAGTGDIILDNAANSLRDVTVTSGRDVTLKSTYSGGVTIGLPLAAGGVRNVAIDYASAPGVVLYANGVWWAGCCGWQDAAIELGGTFAVISGGTISHGNNS
ncbi:MAG: filamentous hemagglutinin N-terminal domain-containing protein, partial [Sulfuritalea sp.]|nr:filamentous hemagglutinin N-terminal domain-containing protein [Sulfuritalea sp.]